MNGRDRERKRRKAGKATQERREGGMKKRKKVSTTGYVGTPYKED
jgi:hypothetical protein